MADLAKRSVNLSDFQGLLSNLDEHDLPDGGAQIQTNAICITPGQLATRRGYREVTFENT